MSRHGPQRFSPVAMTIDVEDWFQVENLRSVVTRDSWDRRELRVAGNVEQMLEALAQRNLTCTFFVLGWIGERLPSLVRDIADAGHEVASHGFGHELLYRMTEAQFRADVARSKSVLEDITGREVCGYRAPSFSITDWAIPILKELGFRYDSSLFSTTLNGRYGRPADVDTNLPIFELRPGLWEVGISCVKAGPYRLPWGGGGYFRLIPYPIFRFGIDRILSSGSPYVFYLHPWELDPNQPRIYGLARNHRFRHYLNLGKCAGRWEALLDEYRWSSIASMLAFYNRSALPSHCSTGQITDGADYIAGNCQARDPSAQA